MALANFPVHIKDFSVKQLLEQWHRIFDGGVRLINTTTSVTNYIRENVDGFPVAFTSGLANTEFSVNHGLGRVPIGYIVLWTNIAAKVYQGPTTGTAWTSAAGSANGKIFIKCDVATVSGLLFII